MISTPILPCHGSMGRVFACPDSGQMTSIPEWLQTLIEDIAQYQCAVRECVVMEHLVNGTFTLAQAQDCLIQFYPFMESVPYWNSFHREKTSDPAIRTMIDKHMGRTKRLAQHWRLMAEEFGLCRHQLFATTIRQSVEKLNRYVWEVNRYSTLAEGMFLMGYAFGRVSKTIASSLNDGFMNYEGRKNVKLTKNAFVWARNQSTFPGEFAYESLEIAKRQAPTKCEQNRIRVTTLQSLELLLQALEECGTVHNPCDTYSHIHDAAA